MRSTLREAALEHLGRCPNLDWLELAGCQNVMPAGLAHLEPLEWLWVLDLRDNPQLDDRAAEPLARLKALRLLFLSGTNLTPTALARLNESLPKCTIFHKDGVLFPKVAIPK